MNLKGAKPLSKQMYNHEQLLFLTLNREALFMQNITECSGQGTESLSAQPFPGQSSHPLEGSWPFQQRGGKDVRVRRKEEIL